MITKWSNPQQPRKFHKAIKSLKKAKRTSYISRRKCKKMNRIASKRPREKWNKHPKLMKLSAPSSTTPCKNSIETRLYSLSMSSIKWFRRNAKQKVKIMMALACSRRSPRQVSAQSDTWKRYHLSNKWSAMISILLQPHWWPKTLSSISVHLKSGKCRQQMPSTWWTNSAEIVKVLTWSTLTHTVQRFLS